MTAASVTQNRHIARASDGQQTSFTQPALPGLFRHVSMGGFRRFARYIHRLPGYSTNARLSTVPFVLYPVQHKCNYRPNNALRPIFQ